METNGTHTISTAELCEARRSVRAALRCRRLSATWVDEHLDDLLARAAADYAAKLAAGERVERPLGWLVHCACWRAQDLLRSQGRRPECGSVEETYHLPDERTPGPEERALERDSEERLRSALAGLPELDCKLLALVYFEDLPVNEAARRLGVPKSTAKRRHNAALERLRGLFAEERTLASPASIGLLAWILARSDGATAGAGSDSALGRARAGLDAAGHLLAAATHRLAEAWRRLSPLADPAAAGATSGGGRALGACGFAAASLICGVAASGVLPALPASHSKAHPRERQAQASEARASTPSPSPAYLAAPAAEGMAASAGTTASPPARKPRRSAGSPTRPAPSAPAGTGAAPATSEFGVEAGQGSSPAPSSAPAPSGGSQLSSPAATSTPAAGKGSGATSTASPEFGM